MYHTVTYPPLPQTPRSPSSPALVTGLAGAERGE